MIVRILIASLIACNGDPKSNNDGDSNDSEDTGTTTNEDCSALIEDTIPKDLTNPYPVGGGTCSDAQFLTKVDCVAGGGTWTVSEGAIDGGTDWFYRDNITLNFSDMNPNITITGVDSTGTSIEVDHSWNDTRDKAYLIPSSGAWGGNETYDLTLDYCESSAQFTFSTSEFGAEMTDTPVELEGNVYKIDLAAAEYSTPQGIDVILANNITQPLLFGVKTATETSIDFIAKLGVIADNGIIYPVDPLWSFPNATYTPPYFEAASPSIEVEYPNGSDTIAIAIYDFELSGTFSPDGTNIGGAKFSGLGNTAEISAALYQALPRAQGEAKLCEDVIPALSDGNGGFAECIACPGDTSGDEFCVFLAGEIDVANMIPADKLSSPLE